MPQEMFFRRHRVLDSQDELHVRAVIDQSFVDKTARTDASGDEIFRQVKAFSETDADVLLVDGIRSIETLHEVRKVTTKPILFNQISGLH